MKWVILLSVLVAGVTSEHRGTLPARPQRSTVEPPVCRISQRTEKDFNNRNANMPCCPTLREHPLNTPTNQFIGINDDGSETIQDCGVEHLVFNLLACYCDWSDESKSRIGPCPVEFAGWENPPDPPVNAYRQWGPVGNAYLERRCTEVLPPCPEAQDDRMMYFNFTDCRCYFTSFYFARPEVIYCQGAGRAGGDPAFHAVETFWDEGASGNGTAIVIGNREGTYNDNWRGLGYTGDWPIPWEGGPGAWVIDAGNYIRDAMLPDNSGRDIVWTVSYCHDSNAGNGEVVIATDGCVIEHPDFPNGVGRSASFEIVCDKTGNQHRCFGQVAGVDFSCQGVRGDCHTIEFTFCSGNFFVTVDGDDCGGGDTGNEIVQFNQFCPFALFFDQGAGDTLPGNRKFTGTVSAFDVWKDSNRVCTPWP